MSLKPKSLLNKKIPFRVHLSIQSLEASTPLTNLSPDYEYSVFFRRGSRNSSSTKFVQLTSAASNASSLSDEEESNDNNVSFNDDTSSDDGENQRRSDEFHPSMLHFNASFQFKVTMFLNSKKKSLKKKILYLILQKRRRGSEKIHSDAKISIDLSSYVQKMLAEGPSLPTKTFDEVMEMGRRNGKLRFGLTLENLKDMPASNTMTMMMTTMDETTVMDEGDDNDDDDVFLDQMDTNGAATETKQSMEETRKLREKIRELSREVCSLTIQNEQRIMQSGTEQDIAKLERERDTQRFLAQELKSELESIQTKYEEAQNRLKQQLEEEKQKSKELKEGFETQLKTKEQEIISLRERIDHIINSDDQDSSKSAELETQIRELKEQYRSSVQEFESFKEEREKHFLAEKKKDELLIRELKRELAGYQHLARQNNAASSASGAASNNTDNDSSRQTNEKVKEIQGQLETLRKSKEDQEAKEKIYLNEIDELKKKMESYEMERLSAELSRENTINEYKSQVLAKEQQALKLQDELDEKIQQEDRLTNEVKDLEQRIASTLSEKAEFEQKVQQDLKYAQQRMRELEQSLKKNSGTQVMCTGHMRKQGRMIPNWKRRFFSLNGVKNLTYAVEENGEIKGGMVVSSVTTVRKNGKVMFRLNSGKRNLLCYPDAEEDVDKWLKAFIQVGVAVNQES